MPEIEVKIVLFDLWNTLIYNIPRPISLAELGRELGIDTDRIWKNWRKYFLPAITGEIKTGEERARRVLRDLGLPLEYAGRLAQYERELRSSDTHFFPGVPEMLEELHRRNYKSAIVSNTSYLARPVVERLGLEKKVDQVILSAEVGVAKPDVRIYRLAAQKFGMEPGDCLFVGDGGDNELDGALEAGCKVAVVHQEKGFAHRNPGQFPAEIDLQLPSVIDVLSYL